MLLSSQSSKLPKFNEQSPPLLRETSLPVVLGLSEPSNIIVSSKQSPAPLSQLIVNSKNNNSRRFTAIEQSYYFPKVVNISTPPSISSSKAKSSPMSLADASLSPSLVCAPVSSLFGDPWSQPSGRSVATTARSADEYDGLVTAEHVKQLPIAGFRLPNQLPQHLPDANVRNQQIVQDVFDKLCSLCRNGKCSEVEHMLDDTNVNISIDYQDLRKGNTLLHVACQNGNKKIIRLCLRRGARANIQNNKGQTPLHYAFAFGFKDVGEYLISKGADDSVCNFDSLTCYEGLGAGQLADI
jgi:hypothetical protein